jgi:integrase
MEDSKSEKNEAVILQKKETPQQLAELEESFDRLKRYAANAKTENTRRAYAADLEDFQKWCESKGREWLPAKPETVGLYIGAKAEQLSLSTLERRLAAISVAHKEEGYDPPTSVAEAPLREPWKGIVREKTRAQDGAPPLLVDELKMIVENLPRYAPGENGRTGDLTLTALRDRAVLLVGWTGALRRSELVSLQRSDVTFIEGEGANIKLRDSKTDQEGEGLVKGLPHGDSNDTCPVRALRTWFQAVKEETGSDFEGPIFRRFYRGESIGEKAITGQYVSKILKRHAQNVGLDPKEYSSHSLRAGFITQAIRSGKPERRVKEHSGHKSWEAFNQYVKQAGTFQDNPAEGLGL